MKKSIITLARNLNISLECMGEIELKFQPLLNFMELKSVEIAYLLTTLQPVDLWRNDNANVIEGLPQKIVFFNKMQTLLLFWCQGKSENENDQTKIKKEQILFIENLCSENRVIENFFVSLFNFYDNATQILKKYYPTLTSEKIKSIIRLYITHKQACSIEFYDHD